MAFARNLKFWNNNKGTEVSDQDGELLLTSEHTPAVVDFDSFAQRAHQGTAIPEDFEAQKAAIEERFPHSGKTSLLGRIADATRNLKDAALHKITMPKAPASEAVIDHVPAKKSWREKLSGISEKTATGLSAAKAKTTDWTKARAYEARSFGSFIGSTPNTVAKGVTGHDIADIKNYGALSVADTSSKVSGFFSKAREKFRQTPIGTDPALKAEPSEKSGTALKSVGSFLNRVQRSLRDPATVAQALACGGIGFAAKKLTHSVATGVGLSLGASALATAGAAMAGGAALAVFNGHLRDEFAKAKAARPQEEITGYDNRSWLRRSAEDLVDFSTFGARTVFTKAHWKSFGSHLLHEKSVVAKRAGLGAVSALVGWKLAGTGDVVDSASDNTLNAAQEAAQEAAKVKAEVLTAAHHTNLDGGISHDVKLTVEEAQLLKDRAVDEYWHGDKAKGIEMFREAAKAGNAQAIRDLAELKIGPQVTTLILAAMPEPSLKLDLSDVIPETTIETAPELPVDPSIFSEDAIKYAIGGGGVVAAGTIAAPAIQSGLMAASMATSKPVEAPRAPEVAQMCKVIDKPDAPGLVDLKCGTPRLEIMNPRDAIGFERQAAGEPTRIEYFVLDSQNSYRTLDIEESIVNDTQRFSDIVRKLRGQASGLFNQAASLLSGQPAAQNDNEPTELAQAPKIATGYDIK